MVRMGYKKLHYGAIKAGAGEKRKDIVAQTHSTEIELQGQTESDKPRVEGSGVIQIKVRNKIPVL